MVFVLLMRILYHNHASMQPIRKIFLKMWIKCGKLRKSGEKWTIFPIFVEIRLTSSRFYGIRVRAGAFLL